MKTTTIGVGGLLSAPGGRSVERQLAKLRGVKRRLFLIGRDTKRSFTELHRNPFGKETGHADL